MHTLLYNQTMAGPITNLERKIQALLEQNLVFLWKGHLDSQILALELARALEQSSSISGKQSHRRIAPHQYKLVIHPQTAIKIKEAMPELESHLSSQIIEIVKSLGMILVAPPELQLKEDHAIARGSVKITTVAVDSSSAETRQMTPLATGESNSMSIDDAYIIVNGDYHYSLSKPMVTIGRNLDNDIIIENPDVSRSHAQIRLRLNKWVLYDTNSNLGTRLNDQQVKEQVLENGDVISVGSTTLIFVSTTVDQHPDVSKFNQPGGTIPI